jgi:hypothetical protein
VWFIYFPSLSVLSAKNPGMLPGNVDPFGFDRESKSQPATFELNFVVGDQRYRYDFSVTQQAFEKEWLYDETVRKAKVFVRNGQEVSIGKKYFDHPDSVALLERGDNELFRKDASFLSALALFNVGEVISGGQTRFWLSRILDLEMRQRSVKVG